MKLLLILTVSGLMFVGSFTWVGILTTKVAHQASVVCQEHRTLASIAKEESEELLKSNASVLPKINIQGISHQRLVELTEEKARNKARHVQELEAVRKATC